MFCYVIKEVGTNMLQGAFPYSEEGKKMAKKYMRTELKGKLKDYRIESL